MCIENIGTFKDALRKLKDTYSPRVYEKEIGAFRRKIKKGYREIREGGEYYLVNKNIDKQMK